MPRAWIGSRFAARKATRQPLAPRPGEGQRHDPRRSRRTAAPARRRPASRPWSPRRRPGRRRRAAGRRARTRGGVGQPLGARAPDLAPSLRAPQARTRAEARVSSAERRGDLLGRVESPPAPAPRRRRHRDDRAGRAARPARAAAITARRAPREREPGRELERHDQLPRDSLIRRRRPGRVEPGTAAGRGPSRSSRDSQRSQSCSRRRASRPHRAQRGGARRPSSSASIARHADAEAHTRWRANCYGSRTVRKRFAPAHQVRRSVRGERGDDRLVAAGALGLVQSLIGPPDEARRGVLVAIPLGDPRRARDARRASRSAAARRSPPPPPARNPRG